MTMKDLYFATNRRLFYHDLAERGIRTLTELIQHPPFKARSESPPPGGRKYPAP